MVEHSCRDDAQSCPEYGMFFCNEFGSGLEAKNAFLFPPKKKKNEAAFQQLPLAVAAEDKWKQGAIISVCRFLIERCSNACGQN